MTNGRVVRFSLSDLCKMWGLSLPRKKVILEGSSLRFHNFGDLHFFFMSCLEELSWSYMCPSSCKRPRLFVSLVIYLLHVLLRFPSPLQKKTWKNDLHDAMSWFAHYKLQPNLLCSYFWELAQHSLGLEKPEHVTSMCTKASKIHKSSVSNKLQFSPGHAHLGIIFPCIRAPNK